MKSFQNGKTILSFSKKYMLIWNCKTDEFFFMKTEVAKKILDSEKNK